MISYMNCAFYKASLSSSLQTFKTSVVGYSILVTRPTNLSLYLLLIFPLFLGVLGVMETIYSGHMYHEILESPLVVREMGVSKGILDYLL
jgi:hypothetical protein